MEAGEEIVQRLFLSPQSPGDVSYWLTLTKPDGQETLVQAVREASLWVKAEWRMNLVGQTENTQSNHDASLLSYTKLALELYLPRDFLAVLWI